MGKCQRCNNGVENVTWERTQRPPPHQEVGAPTLRKINHKVIYWKVYGYTYSMVFYRGHSKRKIYPFCTLNLCIRKRSSDEEQPLLKRRRHRVLKLLYNFRLCERNPSLHLIGTGKQNSESHCIICIYLFVPINYSVWNTKNDSWR